MFASSAVDDWAGYILVLGDTDDIHDVSRYQKYRDTFVDTHTHVAKPLIRYFRNFVTLESTFRLYWNYPSTILKVT